MTYIDAFNIIEAFVDELESAVENDLYVTLDTKEAKNLLEALNNVDY